MDHELVEPFETEDGSLDGLSPRLCFALGVEWEMFRRKLKAGVPFTDLATAQNAARLVKLVERQRRFVEHHALSEDWIVIIVGGHFV